MRKRQRKLEDTFVSAGEDSQEIKSDDCSLIEATYSRECFSALEDDESDDTIGYENDASSEPKQKRKRKGRKEQMTLDVGQKKTELCECGMLFTKGDPEDEKAHDKHHGKWEQRCRVVLSVSKYKEKVVSLDGLNGDMIILLTHAEAQKRKFYSDFVTIQTIVKNEIEFSGGDDSHECRTLLYVTMNGEVAGVVTVEDVNSALVVDYTDPSNPSSKENTNGEGIGIRKIWVNKSFRRRQVATTLLDTARRWASAGKHVEKQELCFSTPSTEGARFICAYIGSGTILTYSDDMKSI